VSLADAHITGVGLAISGVSGVADLLSGAGDAPPLELTGREMRNKDRASRLGLRCAEGALRDAGLLGVDGFLGPAERTAVVVSSNLGTVPSVCDFTDVIARRTVMGLSAFGLPETGSNVVAGWIAIRHGLRGPNLTVCSGDTSGLDAVFWAQSLLASERADVAVVAGVEPAGEAVWKLAGRQTREIGVAIVLERRDRSAGRARVGRYRRMPDGPAAAAAARELVTEPIALWLTGPDMADSVEGGELIDLEARYGYSSGAFGVLQCATAVAHLDGGGAGPIVAIAGGGSGDAAAVLTLHRSPDRPPPC
jgi:3-oxoacyl-[acyl-carrier-protein] synthase II